MKLFSPAKLNLFFRILKKRDDGFHEIASLMQAISFCDTLHFACADEDTLTCTDPYIPTGEDNFIHQARTLFREKTGFSTPLSIHIEKQIPPEGGLGGGSGNIATTLYAMNQLSNLLLDEATLSQWAGEISSDAPFFFSRGTAYVAGRGEKVQPLEPLPPQELYLAKPHGAGLSTPLVYSHCRPHSSDPSLLLEAALQGKLKPLNDLEFPAFALRPDLKEFKADLMRLGFDAVSMTGSGTIFFCLGPMRSAAPPHIQLWKTSFLSREEGQWYVP